MTCAGPGGAVVIVVEPGAHRTAAPRARSTITTTRDVPEQASRDGCWSADTGNSHEVAVVEAALVGARQDGAIRGGRCCDGGGCATSRSDLDGTDDRNIVRGIASRKK